MRRRPLTRREKVFSTLTAIVVVGVGVYFGFLEDFLIRYQSVRQELETEMQKLERQQKILREGPKVDLDFAKIEDTLPSARPGKSPDMAFSEEMEALFQSLGLPTPEFGRDSVEEVPKTAGFSYLTLPIQRVKADLAGLTKLLKSFAERNLLIRGLNIKSLGSARTRQLEMAVEVAQVIRTEEMAKAKKTRRAESGNPAANQE